jgi:xanthine dehydrogenase accessory factor
VPALDAAHVALDPSTYVVVATLGEADEETLAVALASRATYVAQVASRRRAEQSRKTLLAMGLTPAALARLKAPAGLDLGGASPAHIAVSILAEMVQHQHATAPGWEDEVAHGASGAPVTAVDPVCGMAVEAGPASLSYAHAGHLYHFCCGACRGQFERDPGRFLAGAPARGMQ